MTRGQRGRAYAKAELILAVLIVIGGAFLYVAQPARSTPMSGPDPMPILIIGIAGVVIGLGWMIRIYRADPEPDQGAWRYRARR
jgi:hypothetical protein